MLTLSEIKENGIVGAGGAGFPSYVKLSSQAEIFIVNAAECEPLLHKDKEILLKKTDIFFKGLNNCLNLVKAKKCVIGIKSKYRELVRLLEGYANKRIEIFLLRDFYPAGDEISLIFEITGRIVEAGALPITQNVIVNNVETIYNVGKEGPVVSKFVTIGGDVKNPISVEAPIGISYKELIEQAIPRLNDFDVIIGGPMMGRLAEDLTQPVTKTTGGLLVFPKDHSLIRRFRVNESESIVNITGRSACDQCCMCTELCPRNLLGHPIQPHKAMRMLLFSNNDHHPFPQNAHTLFCCECNLCSMISCPEGLSPGQVSRNSKRAMLKNKISYSGKADNIANSLISYRRTPMSRLLEKLDLKKFKNRGPLTELKLQPEKLKIMLRQHIGVSAKPVVRVGQNVLFREKIGTVDKGLGAEIHSPVDGNVLKITGDYITIKILNKEDKKEV